MCLCGVCSPVVALVLSVRVVVVLYVVGADFAVTVMHVLCLCCMCVCCEEC